MTQLTEKPQCPSHKCSLTAPCAYPDNQSSGEDVPALSRNERRRLEEVRRRASHSTLVRELAEEVAGAPHEMRTEVPGFDR